MLKSKNIVILVLLPLIVIISIIFIRSKNQGINKTAFDPVIPDVETTPVPAKTGDDAADDPAIWLHPEDITKSTIIGTNKKGGLAVYNLNGNQIYYYAIGKINNVDVRYNFLLHGEKIDIAAATNRTNNTIELLRINKQTGELSDIAARDIKSGVSEVYGISLYVSPVTGDHYVFVNGKAGKVEQWKLNPYDSNKVDATMVREFWVGSQVEGMVADDEKSDLYIGEENVCVWKYGAEPEDGEKRQKINMSDTINPNIAYDIEGLTLYYAEGGKGYLIVSSQGNNSFALFNRQDNNQYIMSFSIETGKIIDGAEETDGIDITNMGLGPKFPMGLFVVQDGLNYINDSLTNQNFKLISWEKIANLASPPLIIDTNYCVFNTSPPNN